jgi:hypothetical protein
MLRKSYLYLKERKGAAIFCLLLFAWIGATNWDHLLMKTLVSECAYRDRSFWQANQGFSIEKGRFSLPLAKITFWKSAAVNAKLFLEFQKIEEVIESKWLANNTAVFLHLNVRDLDPGPSGEAKIIVTSQPERQAEKACP